MTISTDIDPSTTPSDLTDTTLRAEISEPTSLFLEYAVVQTTGNDINSVFLNSKDFRKLFPHAYATDDIEAAESTNNRFIRVADRVYKVAVGDSLVEGVLGVHRSQLSDTRNDSFMRNENRLIEVSAFRPLQSGAECWPVTKAAVKVSLDEGIVGGTGASLELNSFKKLIQAALKDEVITSGQTLYLEHEGARFKLQIGALKLPSYVDHCRFALLDDQTKLDITSGTNVNFVEQVDAENISYLSFDVDTLPGDRKTEWYQDGGRGILPVAMHPDELKEMIQEELSGKSLLENEIIELNHSPYFKIGMSLSEVGLVDDSLVTTGCKRRYEFADDAELVLDGTKDLILLSEDKTPIEASELKFIIQKERRYKTSGRDENNYVSAAELNTAIRERFESNPLFRSQKFMVDLSTGQYLVELGFSSPRDTNLDIQDEHLALWSLDENTELKFQINSNLDTEIVDDATDYFLKSVEFKVSMPKSGGMAAFFGGGGGDEELTLLTGSEIRALLDEKLPSRLIKGLTLTNSTPQGQKLIFEVEDWAFKDQVDEPDTTYGFLAKLNKDTRITFSVDQEAKLTVLNEATEVQYGNIAKKLREEGLGGLDEQIEPIMRNILMPNMDRELAHDLGLQMPRGLLLYGPPGTGKTTLAKVIGKLMGCDKNQIKQITATDLLDKYVGETEKMIRELFEAPETAAEQLKDKSPPYLLIIDEMEGVFSSRKGDNRTWENNRVNAFLAKLDGLSRAKHNNLLVVGVTNHYKLLDSALLRGGRFGLKVEVPLPTLESRREIFQIHLKHNYDHNTAADDIDVEELARLSEGLSGADIREVVQQSRTIPAARIQKKRETIVENGEGDMEALRTDKDRQLNMADLVATLNASKKEKESGDKPPPGMFT